MIFYLNCTANLGDFVQSLPVLSGIVRNYGKITFIIRHEMRKFKGIKEFLYYQDLFDGVYFDDERQSHTSPVVILSSWTREDKNDPNRPIETCRYENWLRDRIPGLKFKVDDNFILKFPNMNVNPIRDKYIVGDRWNGPNIDERRETNVLSYLNDESKFYFLDYNRPLLENCWYISTSEKPFITNFTGIGMIADLLNKESFVVWKAEDWKSEFRNGNDINWDNGKNIDKIFEKHFYLNRKAKLVHANDLQNLLL